MEIYDEIMENMCNLFLTKVIKGVSMIKSMLRMIVIGALFVSAYASDPIDKPPYDCNYLKDKADKTVILGDVIYELYDRFLCVESPKVTEVTFTATWDFGNKANHKVWSYITFDNTTIYQVQGQSGNYVNHVSTPELIIRNMQPGCHVFQILLRASGGKAWSRNHYMRAVVKE